MNKLMIRMLPVMFFLMPVMAMAEELDPATQYPWVGMVLGFLGGLPGVGDILAKVISVVMVVGAVMTVVATALDGLSKALEGVLNVAGLKGVAEKVKAFHAKVAPWVKYLSLYNVQKKKPEDQPPQG